MPKKTLADQIRAAVRERGLSAYRLAKDTGLDEVTAARFMRRAGNLTLANAHLVLDYLGATVTFPPAPKKTATKPKARR